MTSNRPTVPIPQAIVRLNRLTIVVCVVAALVLRAPALTTALFLVVGSAALFGRNGSLIYAAGTRLLRPSASRPGDEDPGLMRFNNAIAAVLLGLAQIAFALHVPLAGWILAGIVACAAAVALAGFCFGCFLYFQFKLNRSRLFGSCTDATIA